MVGYVLAGIAIGPYMPGLMANPAAVNQLADFGVVPLMFANACALMVPRRTNASETFEARVFPPCTPWLQRWCCRSLLWPVLVTIRRLLLQRHRMTFRSTATGRG